MKFNSSSSRTLWLCLLSLFAMLTTARGQDDPFNLGGSSGADLFSTGVPSAGGGLFGGDSANTGPDTTDVAGTAPDEEELSPVIQMLRESPPESPAEMARALNWMHSLRKPRELDRLLSIVRDWPPGQKTALSRAGGTAFWIRLRGRSEVLSEASQQLIGEILRAPAQQAKQPQWIDSWIAQLASDSPSKVLYAQQQLHDAGFAGISRLLVELSSGSSTVPGDRLRDAILSFGEQGTQALQLATTLPPSVSQPVVSSIDPMRNIDLRTDWAVAAFGDRFDETFRNGLIENVPADRLPSTARVVSAVEQQLDQALLAYNQARTQVDPQTVDIWQISADGQTVEHAQAPKDIQQLRLLAHWARQTLKLNASEQRRIECLAILLQDAYQKPPSERPTALASAGEFAEWESVSVAEVLAKATDMQLHGAALSALQLLASGKQASVATVDVLVKHLTDSRPAVRYTALEAITKIDPSAPFYGAETALVTATEMARLADGPTVLVIGLHAEMRQAVSSQLEHLFAARAITANSARAAAERLSANHPFELVVVADRVLDQSLYQLLQRLRNGKHSRSLPIAVMTDSLTAIEESLIENMPGASRGVLSRDEDQMRRVVQSLHEQLDTEPLDVVDRAIFARAATEFLVKVTSDRSKYYFYPVADIRDELAALNYSLDAKQSARLLSGLGTRDGQWELVKMAADSSQPQEQRISAAASFSTSADRHGIILPRDEVLRVYDLYNELGPRDRVAAQALGQILDVIESRQEGS
ncbi:MAG TPA: hypothetical protein DDW52_14295 [Planctomycetaceae bacterium]|nr:hypothetical protein [Planctomycetaceae bacterium]